MIDLMETSGLGERSALGLRGILWPKRALAINKIRMETINFIRNYWKI